MEFSTMLGDLRAIHAAREGSRIHMVLNVQVIEQLTRMQSGGTTLPLTDSEREIWPERATAGR